MTSLENTTNWRGVFVFRMRSKASGRHGTEIISVSIDATGVIAKSHQVSHCEKFA
jgi:hypothetical protein